jgi:putative transposase
VGAIACRCQRQHPAFAWGWVRALLHSLDAARTNILALTTFPKAAWRPICSTTPKERLNREIRRRTDVVGIPPDRTAQVRLVGDVLAEQHDEWTEQHRYLSLDIVAKSRLIKITNETQPTRR